MQVKRGDPPLKRVPVSSDDWHTRLWERNRKMRRFCIRTKSKTSSAISNACRRTINQSATHVLTWMVGLLVMEGQSGPCQQAREVAHTVNVAHTISVYGNCLETFVFYTSRELHLVFFHSMFHWVLHHQRSTLDVWWISIFCWHHFFPWKWSDLKVPSGSNQLRSWTFGSHRRQYHCLICNPGAVGLVALKS